MTTSAKLLGRKQQLLERLHEDDLGPHERDEIERLIKEIDTEFGIAVANGTLSFSISTIVRIGQRHIKPGHA